MAFEIEFNDRGEKEWWRSRYGNEIAEWFVAEAKSLGMVSDKVYDGEDVQALCGLLFSPNAMRRMQKALQPSWLGCYHENLRNYARILQHIALIAQEPTGTIRWG